MALVVALSVGAAEAMTLPQAAAAQRLPAQVEGTASGHSHKASADDTEASQRAGRHNAAPATGGLRKDDRLVEQPKPTAPGHEGGPSAVADPAGPAGFDAATSKELPEKGAKDRQVFANPDGSETTRFYSDRRLFQGADGGWHEIDSDLESRNGRWKVKADDRGKSFASRADAPSLASVEVAPGAKVGFSMRGAAASPAVAASNHVRYNEVRPGADLKIEANPLGIKETIILKSIDSPTVWEFPLDLGETHAELVGREVQFLDADGVQVGRIPPGFMTDSDVDPGTGDAPRSEGVKYELVDGGQTLRVSVDPAWLAKPERKFPVYVDPTVTSVESNGDTYVMAPFTNDYSGETELKVGTYDGGAHKAAALLKFSTAGLTNQKVTSATLNLRAIHSYSCSPRDVVIRPLTESWTVASNKTWPGPSWGAEIARKSFAAGYSASCADKWVNFDVTDTVNSWTHGAANNGLRVGADAADTYAWKKFASANSTNAPYLQITHTAYWADYTTPTNVVMPTPTKTGSARITVTNRSTETWTPSSHVLSYRLWDTAPEPDVELAGSYLANTTFPANVAINGSVTLDAAIAKLPPGSYKLQFDVTKVGVTRFSTQGSPMSSPITINIVAGKPTITSWSPNAGFQADTRTPTLVATGEDSDAYPNPLTYQFKLTKPDGVTSVVESQYGPSAWTVPAGAMEWGKGYLWFVRATDGTNVSSWSPGIGISAKVGQPTITSHLGGDEGGLDPGVGNFTTSTVDAMVTVVGPDLAVERTYNSLDPRADRAFGAGWSTAWDTALVPEGDGSGNILATFADGQQARYGLNTDGTYATPPGQQGTLVATAGGGWTLRDVGDVRYRFDATGGLLSITDASGHVQSLTRDAAGHVTRATDDVTGRYLDFDWASGHVTKVSTGPTPTLSYTYTYSGDTLTRACDPEAACVTYDYTAVPKARTVLLDANPAAYWRLNDAGASGASTSSVPGIWRATDAVRTNTTAGRTDLLTGSGITASKFNGTSSKVTLPTGLVQGAHLTLEMWFSTTASGALFGAQNWALGGTAGTQSSATLYVGADGKLRGLLPNGTTTAPMTSAGVVNDGDWHHVALSGSGASQTLYLDGTSVATVSGQINWQAMTNEQVGAAWTSGAPSAPATGASYFNGDIAEVAFYQRPLGDVLVKEHAAVRSGAPKLTTVNEPGHSETTTALTYDAAAERVQTNRDANGGTWRLGAPVTANAGTAAAPDWRTTITVTDPADAVATYVYDPMRGGQMMSLKAAGDATPTTYAYDTGGFPFQVTDPNGNVTELRHDERGNEISRTQCRSAGTDCYTSYREYYLNAADPLDARNDQVTAVRDERSAGQADDTFATTYTYYANGELDTVSAPGSAGGPKRVTKNVYTDGSEAAVGGGTMPAWLLETVTEPGNRVTSYAYRSNGDLAKETDPAGLVTAHEYDGIGRNTAETTISSTVPSGARTTYAYDGASRLVEELEPAVTNAVTGVRTQQRTVNTWRPDGELDQVVVSDALGSASRTTDFGFDGYGRETSVTEADGAVSRVTYDQFGQASTRTDPGGTVWTYTYTGGKRQLATTKIDEFTGGDSPVSNLVVESRAYDPGGRLASVTDAMGTTIEYKYFDDDLLASETLLGYKDPNTSDAPRPFVLTRYAYTGTGAVKELTEGDGRYTTVTAYDPGGRPVSTTDLDGESVLRSTVTTFDDQDNPTDVVERGPAGGDLSHSAVAYDPLGRETQRTDYLNASQAAVVKTIRDERGLPTRIIDAPGNVAGANPDDYTTTIAYDELGQQTAVTAPSISVEADGGVAAPQRPVTKTGYDAFGSATHVKDPRGNITVHGFDKVGRETSTRLPDYTAPGSSTPLAVTLSTTYDGLGQVRSTSDGSGATTSFNYDELGDLVKQTDPSPSTGVAGAVTTSTYTPTGWKLKTTDPTGAVTTATWDQLGRQSTRSQVEREPSTQVFTTKYSYDQLGNPAKVTTPTGLVTTFEHDDLGNPTTMVDPAGVTTTATYDGLGRPTRVQDPRQATTVLDYDLGGRVIETRDLDDTGATLRTRSFTHSVSGNPLTSTDGAGGLLTRTYDALGQLRSSTEKVSDTKSITTTFGYDAAGNISRVTDGRGNKTAYTTNTWGLPESTVEPATTAFPNPADRTFTTTYDKAGRVASTIAPGPVVTARVYDGAGRLTNEAGTGAEASSPDRTFSYDAAGRMTSAGAGNAQESFTYNDRGLVKTANGSAGATTYTWDGEGRATAIQTGAGTTAYSYDSTGRLSSTTDPLTGKTVSYGYDPVGRVASADAGTSKHAYGYDSFGRLASDTLTAGAATTAKINYGYDLADRLTAKTTTGLTGAAANTYGYDKAGRLTSWNNGTTTTNFGWDDADNLTSRGGQTATFNERNQVTSRAGVDYAYSPRGTLTSRTASGITRDVEYDAFGQLITDGSQTNFYDALHRLIYAGGKPQEYVGASLDVTYDGDRRYTYGADGGVLGVGAATGDPVSSAMLGWTDQHTDLVATVNASTGALSGSRTFDPFGTKVASSGVAPALGFQHQYTDPTTGNVAMGARWYQPETGTFASRDAAALDPDDLGNSNRYAYAGANPLTQTDPEGYFWGKVFKAVKKVAKVTVSVAKEVSGYNDLKGCVGGSWSSCGWFVAGFTPVGKVAKAVKTVAKTTVAAVKVAKVVRSSAKVVSHSSSYVAKTVTHYAPKVTKKVSRTASKAGSKVSSASRGVSRAAAKTVTRAGQAGHAAASTAKAGARKAAGSAARAGGRAAVKASDSVARSARGAKAAVQATKARAKQTVKRGGSTTPAGKGTNGVSNASTVQPKVGGDGATGAAGGADDVAQTTSEAAVEIAEVAPSAAMPSGGSGIGASRADSDHDDLLDFVKARPDFTPTFGRGGLPGSRRGLPVTRAGKDETLQRNAVSQPDGIARCENPECRVRLTTARQSKSGVSPRPDEAAVDHIEAMSKGGSGDPSNTQGLCRVCNIRKSDGEAPW